MAKMDCLCRATFPVMQGRATVPSPCTVVARPAQCRCPGGLGMVVRGHHNCSTTTSLPTARSHCSWVPSSHVNTPPAVDPLSAPRADYSHCHQHCQSHSWHRMGVGHRTKWGRAAAAVGLGSFITTVQGLGSALKTHLAIIS